MMNNGYLNANKKPVSNCQCGTVVRFNGDEVLPLTFLSFNVTKSKNKVLLTWQTISEQHNDYFSIERSAYGNNFYEIGKVKSKNSNTQMQQYSFEDFTPLNGENYYRLKQVDVDGGFTYSKTVKVNFRNISLIKLYPNPAKNILIIEGLNPLLNTILSVIDVSGKVVAKTIVVNNNSYSWNVSKLSTGIYYLQIEENKKMTTLRFVKE